jgi:predicted amidohydrolase
MQRPLTLGLAQIDVRLGELEANVERHLEWIERARAEGVELLLFPELSLTGYRLLHLTPRVAIEPATSPWIRTLAEAAGDMRVVVGAVEDDGAGVLFNSALVLHQGEVAFTHRKLYLPTYGIFQEERFFGSGSRLAPAAVDGHSFGLLVCEDLWHPHLARGLAVQGIHLLSVISASPGRIGGGERLESQETWESLTRATALVNTCWVAYCNRVGWEEGSFYTGGSHIVWPGGEILASAPCFEEDLLVARIDLREADRLRWRLPLLKDHRSDIEGAP